MRLFRRALAFLLVVLIVAGGGIYLWLRSSLPQVSGTLAVPGLTAPVRIDRDKAGVPTIVAANQRDAAFALGFLHAQDRLFQMDLERRVGAGRLSEVMGEQTLGLDRIMRTYGIYRLAAQEFNALSPKLKTALESYAAGVNAWIATHRGALPPEYYLLRFRPEPWKPADTLVWGKLMALRLAGNYRGELLRARLARKLSPKQLDELYPGYPKDGVVALGDLAELYRALPLDRLYADLPRLVGLHYASNNWVVDGQHTVSGKPLLANDPHLGFTAPDAWYLARIETPDLKLAGATAPGAPFVIIGHNERIAWGFTTTGGDVEDVFIEKVDPKDPRRYLTPNGSVPFETRQEVIEVRGRDPVTITVRSTRHGPVISDAVADAARLAQPGYVLALQATFLAEGDTTPQAVWDMERARNWDEFRTALRNFVAPEQNMVYADVDGTIGFIAPARIPIRAGGIGWVPEPGWTGAYDWTGYIPFDRLPSALDPPSGRIVTANNKIVPDSYPYFISRDWDLPNRAERITNLLEAFPRQSPQSTAAIQADTLSLMARRLLPLMLRAPVTDPRSRQALERLRGWDYRMDMDEVAPLIFTAWLRALDRVLLADELGDDFADYWSLHPLVVRNILTSDPRWCRDRLESGMQGCDADLAAALDAAVADLSARFGDDMDRWTWGRAHPALFAHPVFSRVDWLRRFFDASVPSPGGEDTVNRGAMDIRNPTQPYANVHGAGLRIIFDLSDLDATRMMVVPGQSGNPLSPHYADLVQPWLRFDWLQPGRAAPVATLRLVPQ